MNIVSPLIQHYIDKGYCRDYTEPPSKSYKLVVMPFAASGSFYGLSAGSRIYFQADTQLDSSVINGIDMVTNLELSSIPLLSGEMRDVLTAGQLAQITLTICDNDKKIISQLACGSMVVPNNNGKHTFTNFTTMRLENCYIEIPFLLAISTANAFVCKFYYTEVKL